MTATTYFSKSIEAQDLPNEWEWVSLGSSNISEIIMGQSPPGASYNTTGEGLPFFQGKAEFSELYPIPIKWCTDPKKVAEPGDILISVRAPVGPTNLVEMQCCIGRGLAAIRPTKNVLTRYLLYILRAIEPVLSTQGKGSTFASINKSEISEIKIPIPCPSNPKRSRDIQQRIVARIEALLAEVRLSRELLDEMRRDCDRITAMVLEEVFINLVESQVRPKTLGTLLLKKPQYGLSEKASESVTGIPILRMGNITTDGKISLESLKYIELSPEDEQKYLIHQGDILFNRTNSAELVGKSAVFQESIKAVFASYLIRVVLDPKKANPKFIAAYINSPRGKAYIQSQLTRAIGQVNVNAQKLSAMPVPTPGIQTQNQIVAHIEAVQSEVDKMLELMDQDAKTLDLLEQSILERAFRGEL